MLEDDSRQEVEGSPANSENLRTATNLIAELSTLPVQVQQQQLGINKACFVSFPYRTLWTLALMKTN